MQERYLFVQDSQSADLCYLKKTVLKLRQWILDQLEAGGGVMHSFNMFYKHLTEVNNSC